MLSGTGHTSSDTLTPYEAIGVLPQGFPEHEIASQFLKVGLTALGQRPVQPRLDLAQGGHAALPPRFAPQLRGARAMPAETILVVSLITLAFVIFAATLFYGEMATRQSRR
jgi:hypothetical protein